MKTYTLTQVGAAIGKSYQQTRDLAMKNQLLLSHPKPCVTEEGLKRICEVLDRPVPKIAATKPRSKAYWMSLQQLSKRLPYFGGDCADMKQLLKVLSRGQYASKLSPQGALYRWDELYDPSTWETPEESAYKALADALYLVLKSQGAAPDETLAKAYDLATNYANLLRAQRCGLEIYTAEEENDISNRVKSAPWDLVAQYLPEGVTLP